ncbi:immunomodulatory protein [Desarmillaria tabescens]|uniref:Immunomodulatory protein n=1 Tax=Armillaria tabescens TaxID=1929756 RepID=A0AA39TMN6_ARMTA|nr:immunomodulatory protein [Desarmillaria tabescens]KAK0464352.1 immunomodulatory protein [Desarmillaria tabescens]
MKLFSTIALALIPSYALAVSVGWDSGYGAGDNSLNNVACSNGENGLESKGYTTYGTLPNFPYIASSDVVDGMEQNITVLTIDRAVSGIFTSEAALNDLTNGQAALGSVEANATQVDASACGL